MRSTNSAAGDATWLEEIKRIERTKRSVTSLRFFKGTSKHARIRRSSGIRQVGQPNLSQNRCPLRLGEAIKPRYARVYGNPSCSIFLRPASSHLDHVACAPAGSAQRA